MFEILEHLLYVKFKDISRTLELSYSFQVFFFGFEVLRPSQQLWSCLDSQFSSNKSVVNNTDQHFIQNSTSEMLDQDNMLY